MRQLYRVKFFIHLMSNSKLNLKTQIIPSKNKVFQELKVLPNRVASVLCVFLKLAVLTILLSIFNLGTLAAQSSAFLNFNAVPTVTGTPGAIGTVYKFSGVKTGVDAYVRIVAMNNATLNAPDVTSSGYGSAWQPQITFGATSGSLAGFYYIDWDITFKSSTAPFNPVSLNSLSITALDLDGISATNQEYVLAPPGYTSYLNSPSSTGTASVVTVSANAFPEFVQAFSGTAAIANIDSTKRQASFQVNYANTATLSWRTGNTAVQSNVVFSMFFDPLLRLNGGTIGSDQTSCAVSFDPALLTNVENASNVIGSNPNIPMYKWAKSTTALTYTPFTALTAAGWTDIALATSATYDPPSVSTTTRYVRLAKGTTDNVWIPSNIVTVSLNPESPACGCDKVYSISGPNKSTYADNQIRVLNTTTGFYGAQFGSNLLTGVYGLDLDTTYKRFYYLRSTSTLTGHIVYYMNSAGNSYSTGVSLPDLDTAGTYSRAGFNPVDKKTYFISNRGSSWVSYTPSVSGLGGTITPITTITYFPATAERISGTNGGGDIVFDNVGNGYVVTNLGHFYKVVFTGATTADVTYLSKLNLPSTLASLAFTNDGRLYLSGAGATTAVGSDVYYINLATLTTTKVNTTDVSSASLDYASCIFPAYVSTLSPTKSYIKTGGTAGSVVNLGDTLQYTIVVKNIGTISIGNVKLADTIPTGAIYIPNSTTLSIKNSSAVVVDTAIADISSGFRYQQTGGDFISSTTQALYSGAIASSDSAVIKFKVKITISCDNVSNTAYVTSGSVDFAQKTNTVAISAYPIVDASSDKTICNGSSTTIGSTALASTTYTWTASTGATPSSVANPTVSPTTTTTYIVTATSTAGGCASKDTVVVTVNPLPTITFTNPSVCRGTTTTNLAYSATTGSPNQYSIDYDATAEAQGFVDVTNVTLPASPIVLTVPAGAAASTYNATITVRNTTTGCVSSSSGGAFTITVNALPTQSIAATESSCTANDDRVLSGGAVTLTASGASTYVWNTSEITATISKTPTTTTTYTVTATDVNGCIATANKTITVTPTPSVTIATAETSCTANDNIIETGASATLTASGATAGYTFNWNNAVAYEYYSGSWTVLPNFNTLTAAQTGTMSNFNINIPARPSNDYFGMRFRASINITSAGAYTFYTASDDGSKLYIDGAQVVDNDGLHGTTEQSGTITLTAGLHSIEVTFFEQEGGENLTVSYEGPSILKQVIPSSVLFTTANPITVSPTTTTTYTVIGTDTYGCTATANRTITVNSALVTTIAATETSCISNDDKILSGDNVNLTVSGGSSYLWSTGETVASISKSPITTTTYTVTITGTAGCTATASKTITVSATPTVGITATETSCISNDDKIRGGSTANLAITSPVSTYSYVWSNTANPNGLTYQYYAGSWTVLPNFSALTATASGTMPNFDINIPARPSNDNFAIRFRGYINITTAGAYTFFTASDDGSKLYIDDAQVVDNDGLHGMVEQSGTVSLSAGMHSIEVAFFEQAGGENLTVSYQGPSILKQAIPNSVLFASATAISVTPSVSTTYTVTATDANGCMATANKTITVESAFTPTITPSSSSVCLGASVNFSTSSISGATAYNWDFGTNAAPLTATGIGAHSVIYSTTGAKTVRLIVSSGTCKDSVFTTITVNSIPTVTPIAIQNVCNGVTTTALNFSGPVSGTSYSWVNNNTTTGLAATGTGNIAAFNAINTGTAPVMSIITVTPSANGCTGPSVKDTIKVNPTPSVLAVAQEDTICSGSSTTLNAVISGGTGTPTYQWEISTNNTTFATISGATLAAYPTGALTVKTYYRVQITQSGNGCGNATSPSTFVDVVCPTVNNDTVCQGGSTTLIARVTNGIGTPTFQWQISTDSIAFTDITGATDSLYPTGALTTKRYYRVRIAQSGNGCNATSGISSVSVIAPPSVSVSVNNPSVCIGGRATLTSTVTGASGTATYQWQSSTDNIIFSNILNETSAAYTTPTLTATMYYKVIVTQSIGGCSTTSATSTVTVVNDPVVLATAPTTTICTDGSVMLSMSYTGGTGTCTIQWQTRANASSAWSNTGITGATYNARNLTASKRFRAVVECSGNGCCD